MAKTTVSKELAAQYPELADKVGQTVDASVVQNAQHNARVNKKDNDKKVAAARNIVTPPVAPAKAPRKRAPAKKAAAKKSK